MAKKDKENLKFKGMKTDELKKKLADMQESLRVLRFRTEGSKSKNVKEPAHIRKEIARALTEINKNNKNK